MSEQTRREGEGERGREGDASLVVSPTPPLPLSPSPRLLRWLADRLNPILVKEARQALKSRQFMATFGLLLICGWVWSILGLAVIGPEAAYGARGSSMFAGYYVILAFPLMVIVPFGAFRSLAVEQEDRTYELLSITALQPWQIVSGKLGSAFVQMLIYLSAVAPCLAFTYMLRGISLPRIVFAVFCTFLASLAFSMVGLLVGTLSGEKHWQVVLSVLLIVGLFGGFWIACLPLLAGAWFEVPFGEPGFWQALSAFLTAYVTYFALFFYAAVARITFASDNRSTRLRIIMLVQYVCFVGWMAWAVIALEGDIEALPFFLSFVGMHWYAMGAMMTGQSPVISMRVRRNLPQSFLGRVLFTWFNPGAGTGYMLAVCGSLAALGTVALAALLHEAYPWAGRNPWQNDEILAVLTFGVIVVCYLVIYLGLGLLVIRFLQRHGQFGIPLGLLVQALLLTVGTGVPLVIQWTSPTARHGGYSLIQISNPFWTLEHMGSAVWSSPLPWETPILLTVLPFLAAVVFVLNLPGVVREVRNVRIARPQRVAEEDAKAAARLAPPAPTRTSPWDE